MFEINSAISFCGFCSFDVIHPNISNEDPEESVDDIHLYICKNENTKWLKIVKNETFYIIKVFGSIKLLVRLLSLLLLLLLKNISDKKGYILIKYIIYIICYLCLLAINIARYIFF